MSRSIILHVLAVSALLLSSGCTPDTTSINSDDTAGSGDGGDGGDGGGDGGSVTIAEIQGGTVSDGADVVLQNVIVTSGVTKAGDGFFVQDAGGGEFSGLYVYLYGGSDDLWIEVGDELTITGQVAEYYDATQIAVSASEYIEVTGEGTPTTDTVDVAGVSDWEVWEGCLIDIGSATVQEVNSYGEAVLTNGLILDNVFFDFSIAEGATYTNVTGVLNYSYEEWKLGPRDENDIEGFEGGGVKTIAEIQQGGVLGEVTVEGVVATSAADMYESGFFVQDAGGGEWSGIYVYVYDGVGSLTLEPGMVFDITGSVSEYYDWTELTISNLSDIVSTGATGTVTADSVDPDTVSDWESWESCLVDLGPATVTATDTLESYGDAELDIGLRIDDWFYDYTSGVSVGTSWSNVTGLVGYSYDEWRIYPRESGDLSD